MRKNVTISFLVGTLQGRQRKNITKDKDGVRTMARKEYLMAALERMNWDAAVLREAISNIEDTSTDGVLSVLDPAIQKEIVFQKQKDYLLPEDPAAYQISRTRRCCTGRHSCGEAIF